MSAAVISATLALLTVLALRLAPPDQAADGRPTTCVWPETLDRGVASPPAPPLPVDWYCSPDTPQAAPIKEYLRRLPASVTAATVSIEPGPEGRATATVVLSIQDEATGAIRAETRVLELVRHQEAWQVVSAEPLRVKAPDDGEVMSDQSRQEPAVGWPVGMPVALLGLTGLSIVVPVLLRWRRRRSGTRIA